MSCSRRKKPNFNRKFLERFAELKNQMSSLDGSEIFKFLSFFEECNSFINPHVSREIVLFELPNLCFRKRLENSAAVTEVLISIHHLPRTAVPHVVFFLALNSVCNYVLPRKSADEEKGDKTRYISFLAFFLNHCNAEKLTIEGKRITEMMEMTDPVLYGRLLLFSDTNCVLTLLQYGLRFNGSDKDSKSHPMFFYILELLTEFAKGLVHEDQELNYGPQLVPRKSDILLKNFKLILRSTYNPGAVIFHMAASKREFEISMDSLNAVLKFVNQGKDITEHSPPNLKHLCRYVIRQHLFKKWCLPNGIRSLPVKPDLIRYLQLCTD